MKVTRMLFAALLVVLSFAPAFVRAEGTTTAPAAAAAGAVTIEGTVAVTKEGDKSMVWIKTEDGKTYMVSDGQAKAADLVAHDTHEVSVTGMTSEEKMGDKSQWVIKVDSFKMVEDDE